MATSPEDLHVDQLADHPELFGQVRILRWKEWAYGEKDPARFIEVTAREAGDGLRLPMTLVAIDAAHNALGAVGLGPVDDEVSEAERAGRTPWILGMVMAKDARMLGIGRRLLEGLQDAAGTLGHRQSWVATGKEAVGFYQECGWERSSSSDWSRPESRQRFWSSQQPFDDAQVSDPCSRSADGTSGLRAELLDRRLVNGGSKKDLSDFIFPTHGQLTELAAGLGSRGLTIWLMRGCGLRIQEALAVQISCFRDGGRTLRVYEQAKRDGHGTMALKHRKLGQYREVPVPGYLWEMVKDLPDGYLFRTNDVFSRYNGYFDIFKRLARKVGIPGGFTPHSLRHAFVSALLARGVPITDVAQWVGHKDINVTYAIYGHLVPNAADRAVSVLDSEYAEWSAAA